MAAFEAISRHHGIPVIYDAAHAFAVRDGAGPIVNRGRMSVLSFHATKVFNTFEGGAVICGDRETKLALDRLCNFGITDEATIDAIGLNAKMSEINAAIGLAQLAHSDAMIRARATVARRYAEGLDLVKGVRCVCAPDGDGKNHYAFPILLTETCRQTRDSLVVQLKACDIFARRYFYPLISDLPMYRHLPSADPAGLPVSSRIASQILCLPIYPDLDPVRQAEIIDLVAARCG